MTQAQALDPITLEVVRNALEATAREMSIIMLRTSHAPIFSEGKDYSCAIYDASGEAIAQAQDCPIHLASIQFQLEECIRGVGGADTLEAGDVILANDPYLGGSHLPDVTMVRPIFLGRQLIAYAINRAHHVDVGGGAPGSFVSDAQDIFQEGLRIPPVRLYRAGEIQHDLFDLILRNVRDPDCMVGDIQAQVASLQHAERRIVDELIPKFGLETIERYGAPILADSERRMRLEIEAIPDGVYTAEDFIDGDGIDDREFKITATITIDGDSAHVDFRGSDPQARGPINAPFAVTAGAVYIGFLCMTDPDIPANAGCYRPITVDAPRGTIVNVGPPGPCVAGNCYTAVRVIDIVRKALAQAVPDRASAGNGDHLQLLAGGVDSRTGRPYAFYEMPVGGWGASERTDGEHALFSLNANCLLIPVEVFETRFPWRILEMSLRRDSGGSGLHQGGLGLRKDYMLLDDEAIVTLASDRDKHAPYGLLGGGNGGLAEFVLTRGNSSQSLPSKKSHLRLEKGNVISMRSPGGGGWGSPSPAS